MARRLKGFRGNWSLSKMHSARGTSYFKGMKPGAQTHWAAFDRKRSRGSLMKAAGMHGRGGSHK